MSAAWDLRRLEELHSWYKERVRRRLGSPTAVDMAIPLTAAQWIIREAITLKPRRIVEFGSGFSTLVFARVLDALPSVELVSLDHDLEWIEFVHACTKQKGGAMDRIKAMSTHQFLGTRPPPFDMVFVDHGPTYDVRIASIAPIVAASRMVGCRSIILDDWHKSARKEALYRKPVTQIVTDLGCSVHPIPASSLPSDQRELAKIVLGPGRRPLQGYSGHEQAYWKQRLEDPSIRSVGRRDASAEENQIEYSKASGEIENMILSDFRRSNLADLSVLDLGYGQGHYTRLCAAMGIGSYHGVDFAATPPLSLPSSLVPSSYSFSDHDIGKPFDLDRKFDIVLGLDVLYHLIEESQFSEALSNVRRHSANLAYLSGLFHDSHTTPHVFHRSLERYLDSGLQMLSIAPWRDNRIGRFRV